MLKKLVLAGSLAAAAALPNTALAQLKICDTATGALCMGYQVTSTSGNPLVVNIWDASAAGTNGRIVSFGLWGVGSGLTLDKVRFFNGTSWSSYYANQGDWSNGPNSGYGITGFSAAAGIANNVGDGFTLDPKPANTSCNVGGSSGTAGVPDCWLTSETKYLEFTFAGAASFANANNVQAGFRAQNTGANGSGSFKCGVAGGNDVEGLCSNPVRITGTVVPEPSTYALMTAGLLGIFGVARRRRNSAKV